MSSWILGSLCYCCEVCSLSHMNSAITTRSLVCLSLLSFLWNPPQIELHTVAFPASLSFPLTDFRMQMTVPAVSGHLNTVRGEGVCTQNSQGKVSNLLWVDEQRGMLAHINSCATQNIISEAGLDPRYTSFLKPTDNVGWKARRTDQPLQLGVVSILFEVHDSKWRNRELPQQELEVSYPKKGERKMGGNWLVFTELLKLQSVGSCFCLNLEMCKHLFAEKCFLPIFYQISRNKPPSTYIKWSSHSRHSRVKTFRTQNFFSECNFS